MSLDPDPDCIDPDRKRPPALLAKPGVSTSDPGLKGYGTFSTLTESELCGRWLEEDPRASKGCSSRPSCRAGRIIGRGEGGSNESRRDPGKRLRTEPEEGRLGCRNLDFDRVPEPEVGIADQVRDPVGAGERDPHDAAARSPTGRLQSIGRAPVVAASSTPIRTSSPSFLAWTAMGPSHGAAVAWKRGRTSAARNTPPERRAQPLGRIGLHDPRADVGPDARVQVDGARGALSVHEEDRGPARDLHRRGAFGRDPPLGGDDRPWGSRLGLLRDEVVDPAHGRARDAEELVERGLRAHLEARREEGELAVRDHEAALRELGDRRDLGVGHRDRAREHERERAVRGPARPSRSSRGVTKRYESPRSESIAAQASRFSASLDSASS